MYLFGVCEVVDQLDLLNQVTSNVSDLFAQVVLGEGIISWQPEADILVARRIPGP